MVHGLLGPMDFFDPAARLPDAEVHAPDLPGYGMQPALAQSDAPGLEPYAQWLADYVRTELGRPVCLLGHSVGGTIAMLAAERLPGLVQQVINVEGNFTLNDASWCRRLAALAPPAWEAELRQLQADPRAWLEQSGIAPSAQRLRWARELLHNQSAVAVHRLAKAVVRTIGDVAYLDSVKRVVDSGTPVHLVAGERSAADWDVPAWVRACTASRHVLAGVGHMMMLEDPEQFCRAAAALLTAAQARVQARSRR